MTGLLFLAVIVLGALLADTRRRLHRLERTVSRVEGPAMRLRADVVSGPDVPGEAPEMAAGPEVSAEAGPAGPPVVPELEAPVASPIPLYDAPSLSEMVAHEEADQAEPDAAETIGADAGATGRRGFGIGFEDLFGRKLPIWGGGITLLVAAVLMVRWSIDAGLLSPLVRVVLGFAFASGLIGAAELARRRADFVQDPRVSQALAGAGIGGLYAATVAAANLYGLIGPATAFAMLAVITFSAMVLALRFGLPSAVLGLVGGLAAPALVQSSEPNVPVLAVYIALLAGGLTLLSGRQRWAWLGISALVGGAGWSLFLIAMGALDVLSTISVGMLVILLGVAMPLLLGSAGRSMMLRYGAAIVAALQLALLVATGDFALLTWGLYGLLSAAFVWLCRRMPDLRAMILVPLFAALALIGCWPHPWPGEFATVMLGIAAIYGGQALWHMRRAAAMQDAVALGAAALGGYAAAVWHFEPESGRSAMLALLFALLPAAGAAVLWLVARRQEQPPFALAGFAAVLLAAIAALVGLPEWTAPISLAVAGVAALFIGVKADNRLFALSGLGFVAGAILALPLTGHGEGEVLRLADEHARTDLLQALLRWGGVALAGGTFAWKDARSVIGITVQGVTAVIAYGAIAQVVPGPWLGLAAAVAVLASAEAMRRSSRLAMIPTMAVMGIAAGLWALWPMAHWLFIVLLSLFDDPIRVSKLPETGEAVRRLLLPALVTLAGIMRAAGPIGPIGPRVRTAVLAACGVVALAGGHVLYKLLFAIDDVDRFVRLGLAERTVWEALLAVIGLGLWKIGRYRVASLALVCAALAHGLYYSVMLFNPLWSSQAVGPWPVVNLLLPSFGLLFVLLAMLPRIAGEGVPWLGRAVDMMRMPLVILFAYATLRQLFAGSVPADVSVGSVENIAWSVLAVGLAIGFLIHGIRGRLTDWRIGSLLVMLAAVAKVFLLDASGLEGLLRIVSFLALGFSLIGIGWLYARYLKPAAVAA